MWRRHQQQCCIRPPRLRVLPLVVMTLCCFGWDRLYVAVRPHRDDDGEDDDCVGGVFDCDLRNVDS